MDKQNTLEKVGIGVAGFFLLFLLFKIIQHFTKD